MPVLPPAAMPVASTLEVYGHSYAHASTAGASRKQMRWSTRLAAMLGAHEINLAVNGSKLCWPDYVLFHQGGANTLFHNAVRDRSVARAATGTAANPGLYPPEANAVALYWGVSDWPRIGNAKIGVNGPYGHALRSCIARVRCSRCFVSNDSTVATTSGTWTSETTAAVGVPNRAGGETAKSATAAGVLTVTVPADFPGGTVVFFFCADPTAGANTVTIAKTVGAGTNATLTSNFVIAGPAVGDNSSDTSGGGAPPVGTRYNPVCYRVTGLPVGGHTFTLTFAFASATKSYFMGYGIEATQPPGIVVYNQPKIPSAVGYGLWNLAGGTGFQGTVSNGPVDDAMVNNGNATTGSVCAEFDRWVQYVDVDTRLAASPAYWPAGDQHPNDQGHALIAALGYQGFRRMLAGTALETVGLVEATPGNTMLNEPAAGQSAGYGGGLTSTGRSNTRLMVPFLAQATGSSYALTASTELSMANLLERLNLGDYEEYRLSVFVVTAVAGARLYMRWQPTFGFLQTDGGSIQHASPAFEPGYCDVGAAGDRQGLWTPLLPFARRGEGEWNPALYGATAGTLSIARVSMHLR